MEGIAESNLKGNMIAPLREISVALSIFELGLDSVAIVQVELLALIVM